jgi:hypothetical protein
MCNTDIKLLGDMVRADGNKVNVKLTKCLVLHISSSLFNSL